MRQLKIILTGLAFLFATGAMDQAYGQGTEKAQESIVQALKTGNGRTIGDLLNDLCDLDLPGYRGTYSKAQAGEIISDFFRNHPVASFRILRQGTVTKNEQYTLAEMKSGAKTWRVYFIVKEKEGKGVIPQIRINE